MQQSKFFIMVKLVFHSVEKAPTFKNYLDIWAIYVSYVKA